MTTGTREPGAFTAALAWAAGTWAALGTVALTAAGTSSRIGVLPPVWILSALAVSASALVFVLRLSAASAAPLWLALLALLPWLPGPIPPAFLIFSGPVGVFSSVVALLLVAFVRGLGSSPRFVVLQWPLSSQAAAAGLIAACLYGAAAWRIAPVIPGGDEPHYLIITQSLLADGDLRIENNHAKRDYLAYVEGDLKPDYLKRGRDGAIYSIHAPGLAVLVLPAFALGGYIGVTIFLALLSAAGSTVAWRAAHRLTGDAAAAWVGWAGVALSAPFFFQAFTIYPDGPAALLVLLVIAALVPREMPGRRQLLVAGAALAGLPWLHTRYAVLSAALGLVMAARMAWPGPSDGRKAPRGWFAFLAIPVVSAVLWLGMFKVIYGTFDPRAPYGGATDEHLSRVPIGLTGLLLDQQFGLIPNAPICLIALVGMPALYRRHRRLAIELVAMAMPYILAVAGFHMWWAGHSSPARFVVPVLLPCALPLAAWWTRHPTRTPRTAAIILLAVSVTITAVLAWQARGALLYNVRDGYSLLLDWVAPDVNLAHARPSLFQTGVAGAWTRAMGWCAALAVAWWLLRVLERRNPRPGPWALGSGLVASLTLMIGATGGWAASGRPSLEPGNSVLRLAAATCDAGRHVTVGSMQSSLFAPDASRRAPTPGAPLWGGRDVPAGRYTVILRTGLNATGTLSIGLGRPELTLKTCAFAETPPGRTSCEVDLPAGATSLWLTPDSALRRTLTAVDLDLRRPPTSSASCGLRAGRAVPTAAGTLFVIDGDVYAEPTGVWVIARAAGRFVVQPSTDSVRLLLRNGQATNTVAISSGDWHDSVSFVPGESREVVVPRHAGDISATVLTIQPAYGYRPADTDPASRDVRVLGVWVELK